MNLARKLTLSFVLAAFVMTAACYERLPALMPTHFDWQGRPDGYLAKWPGAFLMPLVMLASFAVGLAARAVRTRAGAKRSGATDIIELALQGFLCEANAIVLLYATGHSISIIHAMLGALGLFFVVIGNYFGKLRRNRLIGIRTPWSLRDEENWLLTHRLGGYVFVAGGAVLTLSAFAGAPRSLLWFVVLATSMVPAAYSFSLSRKGKGSR